MKSSSLCIFSSFFLVFPYVAASPGSQPESVSQLNEMPDGDTPTLNLHNMAIIPTEPGQIGINPVPVTTANIVYHSLPPEFMPTGDSLTWTATQTTAMTQVVTVTTSGETSVVTSVGPVAVIESADSLQIYMAPELIKELKAIADTCPMKKRAALSACFVEAISHSGSRPLQVADGALRGHRLIAGADLAQLIQFLKQGGRKVPPAVVGGTGILVLAWVLGRDWFEGHSHQANGVAQIPKPTVTTTAAQPTETNKCPSLPIVCPACEGKNRVCQKGKWKGCKCQPQLEMKFNLLDRSMVDDTQKVITQANELYKTATNPKRVTCASKNYNDALDVDTSFVQKLSLEKFCGKSMETPEKKKMLLKSNSIDSNAYDGYSFEFEHTPGKDGCLADCRSAYERLMGRCMGINSHTIQKSGEATFECGFKFSYKINPPQMPDPKPAAYYHVPGTQEKWPVTNLKCVENTNPRGTFFLHDSGRHAAILACNSVPKKSTGGCVMSRTPYYSWKGTVNVVAKAQVITDGSCADNPYDEEGEYEGADAFTSYIYGMSRGSCYWAMIKAMDLCNLTDNVNKQGATFTMHCVKYTVMAADEFPNSEWCEGMTPW